MVSGHLFWVSGSDEGEAALCKVVEAEVAAAFGLFVGFARRGRRRRGRMIASLFGKVPTMSARRQISRFNLSLGLLGQICCQNPSGEAGEREEVRPPGVEVLVGVGELPSTLSRSRSN